jgi:hypothetical protein
MSKKKVKTRRKDPPASNRDGVCYDHVKQPWTISPAYELFSIIVKANKPEVVRLGYIGDLGARSALPYADAYNKQQQGEGIVCTVWATREGGIHRLPNISSTRAYAVLLAHAARGFPQIEGLPSLCEVTSKTGGG